jgi:multiple sugar transport system permease protein
MYADVRSAARQATDRWLVESRVLVQEADRAAHRPSVVDLARLVPGGALVAADSGIAGPARRSIAGATVAVAGARISGARWVELRVPPGERHTLGWLLVLLLVASAGPLTTILTQWLDRERKRPARVREIAAAWGFLAPTAAHVAVFTVIPVCVALYVSLHRWPSDNSARKFVDLENFVRLVRDPLTWISLRNTVVYSLYVPVTTVLALLIALLLGKRPRGFMKAMLLLPYTSSVVAIALIWEWMFQPDFGLINRLLGLAGLGAVDWLHSPATALVSLMVISMWVQLGYQVTLFHAGLERIASAYHDAARIDGANGWRRFWKITFPLLRPVTIFVLVTGLIGAFQVFTYVYVLTQGGPEAATTTLVQRAYATGWEARGDLGVAAAQAFLLVALVALISRLEFKLLAERDRA